MPIKSFGIFSTIIVLICFGITIIMQPFTYYAYEKYFMGEFKEEEEMSNEMEDYVQKGNTGYI